MKAPHLRVTYRRGKVEIAYLCLPRRHGEKVYQSERVEPEMILDFSQDGTLIGLELVDPRYVGVKSINEVLEKHGVPPISENDLAPLWAA